MKTLLTLISLFWAAFLQGQVVLEVDCTIPYDGIRLGKRPKDLVRDDFSTGQVVYRAITTRTDLAVAHEIDTVIICPALKDDLILPGMGRLGSHPFKAPALNNWIDDDATYPLPTSRIWRRINGGEDFRYIDYHFRMVFKDLGLHDAHLINRTARRRKDMFVDRQVRVLLVEEIVLMRYLEPQHSPDDAQHR